MTKASKKPKKKKSSKLLTLFKVFAAFALVGLICCIPAYIFVFKVLPEKDPDNQFNRATILQLLAGESRVYYNNGNDILGAFFDANHRIYVPYGDIPTNIVNALIAAEDAGYWNHDGFSFYGFTRAMVSNLKSGRMRQGGSTLTQQTVKNIFGREERSIKEKGKELINALRMEKHFSKQDILEFYLNQFHVSGTGKGVAIAAQYFFNKDLKDLTLAECAFIAGSVKGPYNYDPFIHKGERKERAITRGKERVNYVLSRMVEESYITQEEMDAALATPLEFKKGEFRSTMSSILERIDERLDNEYFEKLFHDEGIEDWRKAQLTITSTIDAESQDAAKRAFQANISSLQMTLGGFKLPKATAANNATTARKGDYLYGSIDSIAIDAKGKVTSIFLSFGQLKGIVTEASLDNFTKRAGKDINTAMEGQLQTGAILFVSILDENKIDNRAPCQIETNPILQGGLIAIHKGNVIASQGGFLNIGFDRNFKAKRQFGSSWKPLLYALALKYHWNYQDAIENEFNAFQEQGKLYFPRPDHKDKGNVVSIAWAATKSENIASVWLLIHLMDKLSPEEFNEVAAENDYAQKPGESTSDFQTRLRETYGLLLKREVKEEIEFSKARNALAERYRLEGRDSAARALQNLSYSISNIPKKFNRPQEKDYVKHNYKNYLDILKKRKKDELTLDPDSADRLPPLDSVVLFETLTLADIQRLESIIMPVDQKTNYLSVENLFHWHDYRLSLAKADFARFAKEIGIQEKLQKVLSMPLGTNGIPLAEMTTAYQTITSGKVYKCKDSDWGDPCLIKEIKNRDGKRIFWNEVEEKTVLNDTVTSQIAVMLNSVFANGTANSQNKNMSVTSPDGKITHHYPMLGKTGTTNGYTNVTFMGALPIYAPSKYGAVTDSVVAIGSYVGFDDNKPLTAGKTHIAGASGALPQWAGFAKEEINILKLPKQIEFYDVSFLASRNIPLILPNQRGRLVVDHKTGIATAGEASKNGRNIPWLDVPGFTPPQVEKSAAEAAASSGLVITLPVPTLPIEAPKPAAAESETIKQEQPQAAPEANPIQENKPAAEPSIEQPVVQESKPVAVPAAESPKPAPVKKPVLKEDDWDLPADFNGKQAFVPNDSDND